jgi:uncharacterized protein
MSEQSRAWFREPMVWLIIALPLSAVVAGIVTLMIAIRSGSTDAVPDVVKRTAQIQESDMGADRRAIELGLRGDLILEPQSGAVTVRVQGLVTTDNTLRLKLLHAGRASADQELRLIRANDAWLGRVEGVTGQVWNVEIEGEQRAWRLGGRLDLDATRSDLQPMLSTGD